ncbi:Spy/CpxP family protein refolding chaperone [Marinobacter segnicrescens]|uniref:Spy/CpxP family protein refolding chaperone n=1 Tax=Marinobacter segnicrescens TaxID=430453 RepID=UPI003A9365E3
MTLIRNFALALIAMTFAGFAMAQQQQPDQVSQIAELVGLSADQEAEIREIMQETQGELRELQAEATEVQQQLRDQIGPDYDEGQIRDDAARLGELNGEMTALTTLMEARVRSVFTEEQRNTLEQRMREMQRQQQQMRQQMQQRQMQQQQQQQMQ